MAVTEKATGTQTAVISTPHTLATITDPGVYVLCVNTSNMLADDILQLTVESHITDGASLEEDFSAVFKHAQQSNNKRSIPISIVEGCELVATLEQKAGTGRDFFWSIHQY